MGRPIICMVGRTFGRLTVIEQNGVNARKLAIWKCRCQCGKVVIRAGSDLRKGSVKSCGCLPRESATSNSLRHGNSSKNKTKEYRAWVNMRYRCTNQQAALWSDYGGRGITICKDWDSFEVFLFDMGLCPEGCSLDRIDNNQGYGPFNCRWATYSQQNQNRRPAGSGRRASIRKL